MLQNNRATSKASSCFTCACFCEDRPTFLRVERRGLSVVFRALILSSENR